MSTTSPAQLDAGTTVTPAGSGRLRVAAAALAGSAATIIVLLATTPWGDRLDTSKEEVLRYEDLLEVRDAAWPSMLLDGFAFAVIGLTLGLGVMHLVKGRGRIAALVGAAMTTAGGILFAMGAVSFATLSWFATADALSDGSGQALVDYANDHPGHIMGPDMAGFALTALGSLVLAAALIRSRAVPVPAVVVYVLLVLAQFAGLQGRGLDLLQIAMNVLLIGFAAVVWSRS